MVMTEVVRGRGVERETERQTDRETETERAREGDTDLVVTHVYVRHVTIQARVPASLLHHTAHTRAQPATTTVTTATADVTAAVTAVTAATAATGIVGTVFRHLEGRRGFGTNEPLGGVREEGFAAD
jgi:hypothetical protein